VFGLLPAAVRRLLLMREIYQYNQQMAVMGGFCRGCSSCKAMLIGVLFLGFQPIFLARHHHRIRGAEGHKPIMAMLVILLLGWRMTPHIAWRRSKSQKEGGTHHLLLGVFGHVG